MAGKIDARLKELGIELPQAASPAANYVPYAVSGNLVFVAGQVPFWNGELKYIGRLGHDTDIETGQAAARTCALNIIAQVRAACGGDLDRVKRIVKIGVFINSTPDFDKQPVVANGASDLLVEIFGDAGRHARFAVGSNVLPMGVAVEIDAVVEIE
ncbi:MULTISPECIES: RidA family protein [unclassified Minwuia]|jgi:enamine deaminase RidA (YjgF/YER057c/UK114 family)|uniref:RidA family protein n=1 Tax=unclassified Minwuia TaxID=2618799 RepID=UPI00247AB65F|nr:MULTISPECIES: RidA family protein [unclassified Minwuia]MDF1733550.1 RidA family protein [Minwuia sp.]